MHFSSVLDPSSPTVSSSTDATTFTYVPSTSVDPLHLLLNLRILDFIESSRTAPLPYHHLGAKVPLSPPPIPAPTNRGPGEEFSEQQLVQLHKAQRLYSEAGSLPKPTDRALYLKELSQVTALLAYTDPENSIMAPYLAQERREAVADQIEGAILCMRSFPIDPARLTKPPLRSHKPTSRIAHRARSAIHVHHLERLARAGY